jgi:hypothetical protein
MAVPGGFVNIDDYGESNREVNYKLDETKEAVDRYIRDRKIIPLGRFGWMGCTIFCHKPETPSHHFSRGINPCAE